MTQNRDRSAQLATGLAVGLAAAAALRALWWASYVGVIENEGVEYTRLAANLFHGRGYVSVFGGTHTLFPPLYPILIGLAAPLLGSEEIAARAVSLLAGVATVAGVFWLAREVFGLRVAVLAGALAATHPMLVAFSVTTYSEVLYVALATLGAAAAVRCVREPSWVFAGGAGALAGLAYLTRPEGLALAVPMAGLVLLAGLAGGRRRAPAALAMAALVIVAAAAVAAPYAVHLSRIAGGFRWEGKSALNNVVAVRQRAGLSYREAGYGLGPEGEAVGPFLMPDQHALLARPAGGAGSLVGVLARSPVERVAKLLRRIAAARFLGAPPIILLAVAGLLGTAWWRTKLLAGAVVLAPPAVTVAVLLSLEFAWDRYFLPFVPFLVVWAAAGADALGRGASALLARAGAGARARRIGGGATVALLALAVLLVAARGVPRIQQISETRRTGAREAGARLAADAGARRDGGRRPRIASLGLALAHYADGEVVYLPYAEETLALRFLHERAPDYVALRTTESAMTPYAPRWLAEGIGDACAQEITDLPPAAAASYRLWRWTCGAERGAPRPPG